MFVLLVGYEQIFIFQKSLATEKYLNWKNDNDILNTFDVSL